MLSIAIPNIAGALGGTTEDSVGAAVLFDLIELFDPSMVIGSWAVGGIHVDQQIAKKYKRGSDEFNWARHEAMWDQTFGILDYLIKAATYIGQETPAEKGHRERMSTNELERVKRERARKECSSSSSLPTFTWPQKESRRKA